MDLVQLQNHCKRDPDGYREEFLLQHRHFLSQLEIFLLKPSKECKEFMDTVSFLSQVAICYPKDLVDFPDQLSKLLETHCVAMDPHLRKTLVKALILLRNRKQLSPSSLLPLFFKLFRCRDKSLRTLLYK